MDIPPTTRAMLLNIALHSAAAAAREIVSGWEDRASLQVADKGPGDLVTSVDRAAEAAAIGSIRAARADDAILAEESGATGESDFLWVIDPLDGTVNFAHGLPHFAVSVACLHKGKPVVGVIIDPMRAETFSAIYRGGAFLNGHPIRVSSCARLDQALVSTVFPKPRSSLMTDYLPGLTAVLAEAQGVRRSGSMVLDLACVASGRVDAFWQVGMKAWDMAAGCLLVQEAGGTIALDGGATTSLLDARGCIAAPAGLVAQLAPLVGLRAD